LPDHPHTPRIVGVILGGAALVAVYQRAPHVIVPVLWLVVLYAAVTNLDRANWLIEQGPTALGRLIHPSTPATTRRLPGGRILE
jgi:hypothetical protein